MANTPRGTSESKFSVEADNIPSFKAMKVNVGEEKHEQVKIRSGNDPRPSFARGNIEPQESTITFAIGLYDNAHSALQLWVDAYFDGLPGGDAKTFRVISYDDVGRTPIKTQELRECVPNSLKIDDKDADGNNTATATLTVTPVRVKTI